ncbi:helix-turn-helix transcriptional regulator [Mycobacterium sp. TY814]|uniref:helix-turn-helix transcriptional regulator n=1 Tax=unclassified Mycobacterium TaxID=2642494 RepID=UPI00274052A6|nr:helix-turn-helix transcriptional regulator [Mycobacterium sp. TY814]MDP7725292.1 helix-turn-helix transcriptional regulator [Mycobacterium sp. TY814]
MFTVLLDTADLGEAEEVVSASFGRVRMAVGEHGVPTRSRIERAMVGSVSVDVADFDFTFSYAMVPPERILLVRVRSGGIDARIDRGAFEGFRAGQVGAFGAIAGESLIGMCRHASTDLYSVDRALLSHVAADSPDSEDHVRLTGSVPIFPAAGAQLVAALDHVRSTVATDSDAERNPLVVGTAQRYIAASMLATFPNTAVLEPIAADRRDSTPVLLRRAIAFIEENADTDISLADIAGAVYVTPRALQYMFRKHRDCTPMEYVRRVRLHQAHLDLVTGDQATATVGGVARRWGFGHLGRFAVYYRQHYGQSPHVTLRG